MLLNSLPQILGVTGIDFLIFGALEDVNVVHRLIIVRRDSSRSCGIGDRYDTISSQAYTDVFYFIRWYILKRLGVIFSKGTM